MEDSHPLCDCDRRIVQEAIRVLSGVAGSSATGPEHTEPSSASLRGQSDPGPSQTGGGTAVWGRFGQAYRNAISSIRNSRHDNLLVREEQRRLYGNGKRPAEEKANGTLACKKPKPVTWTHKFVCFASTSAERVFTTAAARVLHEAAGLGEKKLKISNVEGSASEFASELYEAFPKLKDAGFEFMKCIPNDRKLEVVDARTPRDLKGRVGNSKVYIRPIQFDLSLEAQEPDDPSHKQVEQECVKCGERIDMSVLRSHLASCQARNRSPTPTYDSSDVYATESDDDDLPSFLPLISRNDNDVVIVEENSTPGTNSSSTPVPRSSSAPGSSVSSPPGPSMPGPSSSSTPGTRSSSAPGSSVSSPPGPSMPGPSSSSTPGTSGMMVNDLDVLLSTFVTTSLSAKQVTAIYTASEREYDEAQRCLLGGPAISSILEMLNERFRAAPRKKLHVDPDDMWTDVVAAYKGSFDFHKQIRVLLQDSPAIDTGGVRRQVFTKVFEAFASNERLFEGTENQLRPIPTAETRSSGIMKILGSIIAHSVCQDGIGFPYLSPTCYQYIVRGEDGAFQFASVEDIPSDSAYLISQILGARDEDDLERLTQSELTIDVFQRCGITQVLKMSTRDAIAQEIVAFDAVGRLSNVLDQLCSGLHTLGVLHLLRAFPEIMAPMLTYTACVSAPDVIDSLYVEGDFQDLPDSDTDIYALLLRFIEECTEKDLKMFLLHCTGSAVPRHKTILIQFCTSDQYGTISSHTCGKVIVFPRGVFKEYSAFKEALMIVIASDDYNIV